MPNTQKIKRPGQHKGYPGHIEEEPKEIKIARISVTGTIIASSLALIGVIIGVVFAFPPVVAYFQRTPTPTSTLAQDMPSGTPIAWTFTPVIFTDIPGATLVPSETPFPPPTGEPYASKLIVVLTASLTEGKSPLPVNFNARDSFVQFADGGVMACGQTNFCTFTWAVYRDQKQVVAPFQGDGTFNYTFSGKGIYSVTVYICRANVCADDGVVITVR